MVIMHGTLYEDITKCDKYFSYQSWYFGYVLAILLVILVFWICKMSGKKHFIIWLPTVLIIVVNVVIYILYGKCIDYPKSSSTHALLSEAGRLSKYHAVKYIAFSGLRRWVDAAWRYALCSAVLSAVGYFVLVTKKKAGKRRITLICACILAGLSVFCALDRSLAVSARIIFEARGGTANADDCRVCWDDDWGKTGNKIVRQKSWVRLGGLSDQEKQFRVFKKDVPVYANMDSETEPQCWLPAGAKIEQYKLRTWASTSGSGWKYIDGDVRAKKSWMDSHGYTLTTCVGYVRINDLLNAIEPSKGYSNPKLTARIELMETDIMAFSDGFYVSPSIMHAFMPLELYVLCPSAVLLFIAWLWMLIKDIKQKKTAV